MAAAQGAAESQYRLGVIYSEGLIGKKNPSLGAEWYRKAAEQGYAGAQYDLGVMYCIGRGVEQDFGLAAMWYEKAAAQGDIRAKGRLVELREDRLI